MINQKDSTNKQGLNNLDIEEMFHNAMININAIISTLKNNIMVVDDHINTLHYNIQIINHNLQLIDKNIKSLFPEKKHLNSRLKELKEIIGFHAMENYEINGSNELMELNNIACEKNLTKDNLSFKDFPNQSLNSPNKSIDKITKKANNNYLHEKDDVFKKEPKKILVNPKKTIIPHAPTAYINKIPKEFPKNNNSKTFKSKNPSIMRAKSFRNPNIDKSVKINFDTLLKNNIRK